MIRLADLQSARAKPDHEGTRRDTKAHEDTRRGSRGPQDVFGGQAGALPYSLGLFAD